jgi:hypothetical protein
MLWLKIKNAALSEFRGRTRYWIIAFLVSSILLIWWVYHQRHTCDFMFHPREVAKTGALLWAWLFVFVGVTNRGKLVFGIVSFIWLNAFVITLGHPRIPSNEYSAIRRLQQIPATVKTLNKPLRTLSDLDHGLNIAPDGDRRSYLSGYLYELSFPDSANASRHLISARPQTYCDSGQRSFLLEENGKIHVTLENRAATINDAAIE